MITKNQFDQSSTVKNTFKLTFLFLFMSLVMASCSKEEEPILTQHNLSEIYLDGLEAEIVTLVNLHRASLGLKKLSPIAPAYLEAISHTKYMIEQGKISHDNFDVRKTNLMTSTAAKIVAENVASGFTSAQSVLNAWLANPSHRINIENPDVQYIGISVQKDHINRNFFTQIFTGN